MRQERKPKVVLIGLDGATWDLIKPWANEGKLPTFKKLIEEGASGELESTIPPTTFPAWQSLFTGLNPGRLGVFDFAQVDVRRRRYRINSPHSFRCKAYAIWNILSRFGYRSAVINVPTAQVDSINGVMVGGPFSFGENFTYPDDFGNVLHQFNYQQYPTDLSKTFLQARRTPSRSVGNHKLEEIAKNTFDSRFDVAEYILQKQKPDFLAFVIFCIDNLQHFFWGEEILEQLWKYLDSRIENFLAELDADTYLILCSDHGFTEIRKTFYISKYLETKGYLRLKKSLKQRAFGLIHTELITMVARRLHFAELAEKAIEKEKLLSIQGRFPDKQGRIGVNSLEEVINWKSSKCIPFSTALYMNCPDEGKERVISSLIDELEHLEVNGERLVERVYKKEQIYSGKHIDEAPDLVLKAKKGVRVLESPFVEHIVEEGGSPRGWKADHTTKGIFLVTGPDVRRRKLLNAKIYDIAPTVLRILNAPIPAKIDGEVLKDLFRQGLPIDTPTFTV